MPMALLEAMSHGKCVLATNVPGNWDVVKDGVNGALVDAGDPAELAHRIDALLADEQLRVRLGAQARQDVERNYTPGTVLGKMLDVYREVRESKRL